MQKFEKYILIVLFIILSINGLHSQDSIEEGIKLYQDEEYEKARQYFLDKHDQNDKDAEINYYLGCSYLMLKDHDEAIGYIEEAVELDAENAEYHFKLGQVLGVKAQNSNVIKQAWLASQVKDEFEKALELDPTHLGAQIACINFYIQAPSVMGGDLNKARKLTKGLMLSRKRMAQSFLIDIAVKEENFKLAEEKFAEYDSTFNDSTDHYSFYNKYGYFLLKQKKYEKAISMFKRQVKLAPNEANPYDSLGDGYRAVGKIPEAIDQYKRAVEIDPTMESSKKNLKELQK